MFLFYLYSDVLILFYLSFMYTGETQGRPLYCLQVKQD